MNDFEQSYIQRWILFITVLGIIFIIDFRILGYEILLILLFCTAFIIPTGLSISRKKITEELVE